MQRQTIYQQPPLIAPLGYLIILVGALSLLGGFMHLLDPEAVGQFLFLHPFWMGAVGVYAIVLGVMLVQGKRAGWHLGLYTAAAGVVLGAGTAGGPTLGTLTLAGGSAGVLLYLMRLDVIRYFARETEA